MRFEEAYWGWQARRLTQQEAGRLLGVGERTFRRYVDRYEEEGMEGLRDKRLTQRSARQAGSAGPGRGGNSDTPTDRLPSLGEALMFLQPRKRLPAAIAASFNQPPLFAQLTQRGR